MTGAHVALTWLMVVLPGALFVLLAVVLFVFELHRAGRGAWSGWGSTPHHSW